MRICTLGDLLLDVIVRLDEPLAPGADANARTLTAPGGQAANVAAWAAALGAQSRFVGKRGSDAAGQLASAGLAERGVEVAGPVAEGRNGVVVSLVGPDGDRTMASDRGVAPELSADELEAQWFECDHLHVAGYSLMRSPIAAAAARAVELARAAGARVSVDLSAWTRIRELGPARFRERLEQLEPDVVFANEAEWEVLGGGFALAPTAVLKRGGRGVSVLSCDGRVDLPAVAAEAVDTTGAGDALAAGFLVGGPELGLATAARCVARLGAMP